MHSSLRPAFSCVSATSCTPHNLLFSIHGGCLGGAEARGWGGEEGKVGLSSMGEGGFEQHPYYSQKSYELSLSDSSCTAQLDSKSPWVLKIEVCKLLPIIL